MESETPRLPGDAIRAELAKRGWTQADLARIISRPLPTINEIVVGKRGIMPEMAIALGAAFGNGAEHWATLEANYRLALVPHDSAEIKKRVRMYALAPVKEMEKRGWIRGRLTDDALESELCRFFGIASLDQEPDPVVATRKTARIAPLSIVQRAWCFRARQLATAVHSRPFAAARLDDAERRLRRLAAYPKEARHVPEVMRECGIRFVVIESLSGGRIDGAAFWLDSDTPVIAMSIRYDRIDSFWFTLMHEFMHIRAGDVFSADDDLAGDDFKPPQQKADIERLADERAAAALIPATEISSFIRRVGPLYSKDRIIQFAHRMKIHPGIVVGQLQHRREIGFSANREMLAKVRDVVTDTALTDGFGRSIAPGLL